LLRLVTFTESPRIPDLILLQISSMTERLNKEPENISQPRVRWRELEMIIFFAICVLAIIGAFIRAYSMDPGSLKFFRDAFGAGFKYNKVILLPQIIPLIVFAGCYLGINRLGVPIARKAIAVAQNNSILRSLPIALILLLLLILLSFILAFTANVASWFAQPHLYSYRGFQFLAIFGFNDAPLSNVFFGFDRALLLIFSYCLYVSVRELLISWIESPRGRTAYRIFIFNRVLIIASLYLLGFLCLMYFNLIHENRAFVRIFIGLLCPVLVVFYGCLYWLFPWKAELKFTDSRVAFRLIFFTFIFSLPSLMFLDNQQHRVIFIFYWLFLLFIITPLSWMVYRQQKDRILSLRGMEKVLSKSKADLQFLRSQINPHFLFNTLNTLYGTALHEGSSKTADGIQKLGDMMRFMMHENNSEVIPMEKEVEYLQNYISLQKLRIGASANINIDAQIDDANCQHNIAPMLLIPFVENAFKHGISLRSPSWIKIQLNCMPREISFSVKNSKHSVLEQDPEKNNSGIGLQNVVERLKILYPHKHRLSIRDNSQEFSVELIIQP
jgi:two-component system LytT family sensor kinase